MSKNILILATIFVLMALVFSGCAGNPANEPAAPAESSSGSGGGNGGGEGSGGGDNNSEASSSDAALKITGNVATEQSWTEDEVKALSTIDVESTNNDGDTETYTGVRISDLLALASPSADAQTLVIVADDGYSAEMTLEEALACENCILSFRTKGGFSSVLPGYPKSMQVKGVVELKIN